MSNAPCFGCTDRKPSCHSNCTEYIEFTEDNRARREAERKERSRYNELDSVEVRRVLSIAKERNRD